MAQDAVDKAIVVGGFKDVKKCRTHRYPLVGGQNWDQAFFTVIAQDYMRMKTSKRSSNQKGLVRISTDMAQHLSRSYGNRARRVAQIAQESYGNRLIDNHPYLEAEVVYVAQEEMAATAVDVIGRRLRLAFLDAEATQSCAKRVVDILAETLNWSQERKEKEMEELRYYLHVMNVPSNAKDEFQDEEIELSHDR